MRRIRLIAVNARAIFALVPAFVFSSFVEADIRCLLAAGATMVVAEARAFGPIGVCSARSTYWAAKGLDQEIAAMFAWLGRDLAVCRAEDYLAAGKLFSDLTGTTAELEATGGAVVAATHAYYFGRDRFDRFCARSAPDPWSLTVLNPAAALPRISDIVYGAFAAYDWPNLIETAEAKSVDKP